MQQLVGELHNITNQMRALKYQRLVLIDSLSKVLPLGETIKVGRFKVRYTTPDMKTIPLTALRETYPNVYLQVLKVSKTKRINLQEML